MKTKTTPKIDAEHLKKYFIDKALVIESIYKLSEDLTGFGLDRKDCVYVNSKDLIEALGLDDEVKHDND